MALELWMHGISAEDPQACMERLHDLGFSAVVLGADQRQLAAAKDLGLGAYACTGTFSRSKEFQDESYLAVDVEGSPREWFGSTCPNREAVREANLSQLEDVLSKTGADGVLLDGCRFASPASGLEAFFTCFCPTCEKKARAMGYDFARMRKQIKTIYRMLADGRLAKRPVDMNPFLLLSSISIFPGLGDWISFRTECIVEHFSKASELVRGMGAKMGAYIFTPCLSPLVGQRYSSLAGLLDIASPMIYRNYPEGEGPACLNKEAATLARFLRRGGLKDSKAVETVNQFLGLCEEEKAISDIDREISVESIERELTRTVQYLGGRPKLVPILYLGDELVENSVQAAASAGLDGVNFFVYKDEWSGVVERISQCARPK